VRAHNVANLNPKVSQSISKLSLSNRVGICSSESLVLETDKGVESFTVEAIDAAIDDNEISNG